MSLLKINHFDIRYSEMDTSDKQAQKILRSGRKVAVAKLKGTDTSKPLKFLIKNLTELNTDVLNILSCIYMVKHPTIHAGATGQGGIWAMVSDIINDEARKILQSRPMFEVIK